MTQVIIKFEAGLRPVLKHQEHDQSSHGNWAKGITDKVQRLAPDIREEMASYFGKDI
jgi:hypothetical protein